MTTRVPIRFGGTGANNAAEARSFLGAAPSAAYDQANNAFVQANSAFTAANSGSSNAGAAYTQANNAYAQANSAYGQANTATTNAGNAYNQANSAYGQANAAYNAANNAQVTVYANNASGVTTQKINFINTSTVTVSVTADSSNANIAFTAAPQTVVNDTYSAAGNTAAAATANVANGLFAISTSAYSQANAAYSQANSAYSQANAAYGQANLAYAAANNSNLKSGGLISGTLNVTNDLIVSGNIYLQGNTTFINVSTYQVNDPLMYIAANNNLSDTVDIGFVGGKNTSGTFSHTGLARDATDAKYKLFDNLPDSGHVGNVIDFANSTIATLVANLEANSILLSGNSVATNVRVNAAYGQANLAYSQANSAYGQANSAYSQANSAYTQANTATTNAGTAQTTAQNAYGAANTAQTTAQNAYGQANTATTNAGTAQTTAQNAYGAANTAQTTAQNAYGQANTATTNASTAQTTAQNAYGQANTAYTQANNAYGQANNAYGQANSAYTAANNRVATVSGTSGRITSSGTTAITLDLATAGAGAASYSSGISALTIDAYGRVTSVTGSAGYVPTNGTGASGTWGISITGNAATATSADQIDGVAFRNTGSNAGTAADSLDQNGITYVVSNISLFGQTDGALYSQAYSSSWQHQIYGDYRTGQIAIRGKNSGTWQSWRTVLDSSNYTSTLNSVYLVGTTNPSSSGNFTLSIGNNGSYSYVQSHSSQPLELNPVGNAVRIAGNIVIHAGNYTSYPGSFDGLTSKTSGTGTYTTSGDFRAPIFYDSNNTGFYIDPASTSNINQLNGNGKVVLETGDTYLRINQNSGFTSGIWYGSSNRLSGTSSYIAAGSNGGTTTSRVYIFGGTYDGTNVIYLDGSNGIGRATGDWRAPIFYDSNNTSYYTDPASTSVLNGVRAAGGFGTESVGSTSPNSVARVQFPGGGAFSSDGSTGAIKIRLPFRNNNSMWALKVRIYNYSTNTIGEYHIGAYSYNNGGYNAAASYQGSASYSARTVRIGNDGTYDCIYIGETNSSWSYPVVSVTDVMGGFRSGTFSQFGSGWDVSIATSFGTIEATITPSITTTNLTSESALYTPIVYDQNNTGYYCDPASTSQFHYVLANNWFRPQGTTGIYWQDYSYYFYKNPDTYGNFRCGETPQGGYVGIQYYYSSTRATSMWDSGGNGGLYNYSYWIYYWLAGNACLGIRTSTTSASYAMYVNGGIYSTDNIVAYSDRRKKTNITTIENPLDIISNLRGVYYNRIETNDEKIDSNKRLSGVIAQEVDEVFPEVVTYAKDVDEYGVDYGKFAGLFIEAFKEMKNQIESLKAEIEILKGGK